MTEVPKPRVPAGRPLVSVVIPCLDAAESLPLQLGALSRQVCAAPWEVVIADNGSRDATREAAESLKARLPALTVVEEPRRGRQHACNAGAASARGDYLVFVDGDDEVAPGFLQAMLEGLREHVVVAGRLDHQRFSPAAGPGYGVVQTEGLMEGFGFLPYGCGGCLGIRREAFEALQGFAGDKDHCEDVDLCWRAQLHGLEIAFVPAAAVAVRQRPSLPRMFRQHRNFGRAQSLLYRDYRRHGMPGRTLRQAAADWWRLGRGLLLLRTADERARWVRRLARCVGHLEGSLRFGVFYV